MGVYDRQKYTDQVRTINQNSWKASFMPIEQLQAFAASMSEVENLPEGTFKPLVEAKGETGPLKALLYAIEALRPSNTDYARPISVDVPVEIMTVSESTRQDATTVLFAHGGGFIYGSPGMSRRTTKRLMNLCGTRCVTPQYRKSPTNPFPAALLDIFCVYLALQSPPPDAPYEPVSASKLVLAGESSGLNLLLALVQVLLRLRRDGFHSIKFHNRDVSIELPAAVTGMCGFMDVTCGLPSWSRNAHRDVLPELQPTYGRDWTDQALWPRSPPRADLYCERSAMSHPLVSLVTAEDWSGSPPLFIATGDEMNLDGNLVVAQRAASQGVPVRFLQYEDMIHVWPAALPKLPHSDHVVRAWAEFIRDTAAGRSINTAANRIRFDTLELEPLDIYRLTELSREDVARLTAKAQSERLLVTRKDTGKL